MIKYLKVKYDESNNIQESFWYLEVDTEKEMARREIEFDKNFIIKRKAPAEEDNYGVFTDNLNVVIAPQQPRYKETIVFDLNSDNVKEITKEEFEKMWSKPFTIRPKETMNLIKFFRRFFS